MDQLDEVRSKIDIVQLISEYLSLKKSGRNFKALCPFHSEKAPSFMVSPERQIFKCFGCNAGGDIFGFLMKMEGMEFGEALRALAKRAGVKLATFRPSESEAEKEKFYEINHLASEFYAYLLVYHRVGQQSLNYLKANRGIKKETIHLFKLGYAPSLWDGLQKFLVGKKGYQTEELRRAGLVVKQERGFRDFFRERIIFPLKDHRGNIVGFSGRIINGQEGPKYINIPETLVYHKSDLLYGLEITKNAIKKQNQAIIVEGEFDFLSSYQAGVENVVAIKGSALTESQVRLLGRFCENIILALDQDLSGDAAARRGVEIAELAGLNVQIVSLSEGKDPDELARKNPLAWKKAISSALPVYDFFLESALVRFDPQTAQGKKKISEELLPIFAKISNEIVKAHYLRHLAGRLGISEESVVAQARKVTHESTALVPQSTPTETKRSREEILEEYLLALVFQAEEPEILFQGKIREAVMTPALLRIIEQLERFFGGQTNKKFTSQEFTKILPPELSEIFNNLYLFDFGENILDKKWQEKEKEKTLAELEKIAIRQKLQDLALKMTKLEKEGRGKETEELKRKSSRLSQKLGRMVK